MKKVLSIIFCLILVLPIISVTAETDENIKTLGVLSYVIENGEVTITDCDTSATGTVEIPQEIEGLPVTVIGKSAFYNCSNIESILLPSSITSLDEKAFYSCRKLKNINITDAITYMGNSVFELCSSLESITFPKNIKIIPKKCFFGCYQLKEIILPVVYEFLEK